MVSYELDGQQHEEKRYNAADHTDSPAFARDKPDCLRGCDIGQQRVIKNLRHAVTDLGYDEKEHARESISLADKEQHGSGDNGYDVKSSKNRFLDFVKSAIVPRTGEVNATRMAAIPTAVPQRRVPSTPPTTTFLKKVGYTASRITDA
jgi:hypothetical protein